MLFFVHTLVFPLIVWLIFQVLDNHVVRYIPPAEYRHYPRYKWSRWEDKYAGVVVGALSMHPFQVRNIMIYVKKTVQFIYSVRVTSWL